MGDRKRNKEGPYTRSQRKEDAVKERETQDQLHLIQKKRKRGAHFPGITEQGKYKEIHRNCEDSKLKDDNLETKEEPKIKEKGEGPTIQTKRRSKRLQEQRTKKEDNSKEVAEKTRGSNKEENEYSNSME